MAILDELAAKLSGRSRAEENTVFTDATTRTYIGTATSDSSDGSVYVALSEDVTMPDDYDGEHGVGVEMPTTVGVSEGDDVVVTVFGGGTMKAPVVTGNPGWGDAVQEQVNNAEVLALEAEMVANATGQHFWPDDDGVHVTEVTQEDWNDSTSASYHSGANVLINALGQLFRDGLNNLLAVLPAAIAIYDGNGNDADNILAEFAADHVRIGGTIPEDGAAVATVNFFDSDADKGALVEGYVSNSYSPTSEDTGWGVQSQDTYTTVHTRTSDGEMEQVNGCVGTADVRLGQSTYWEDGPDGYYQTESTATLEATAQGGTDPTRTAQATASLGVKAVTLNDSTERSYVTVNGQEVPMEQAVAALTTPLYSNTSNVTISTANSDRTGPSVTVPAGTYIIVVAYTFPAASGSGTRATTIGYRPSVGATQYNSVIQGSRAAARLSMFNIVHIDAQTTFTAYVRSDQTSASSSLYIGMTRIS